MKKFLTKSRFKIGAECPTKLLYNDDPAFGNKKHEDEFLKSLAEGGFQVGEYAKVMFGLGIEIEERNHQKAYDQTKKLIQENKNIIIYEASFLFDNYFVKCDVLQKIGNVFKVYEVKAKSVYSSEPGFYNKDGETISSSWRDYLLDCAFQKFVIQKCYPETPVNFHLSLMDKDKKSTVDQIHQQFLLRKDEKRSYCETNPELKKEDLGISLLANICVDSEIKILWQETYFNKYTFEAFAKYLSQILTREITPESNIGGQCKSCEFRIDKKQMPEKKSGFEECWAHTVKQREDLYSRGTVLDIWKLHHTKKDAFFSERTLFLDQIDEEDLKPKSKPKKTDNPYALTNHERQWLQVKSHGQKNHELHLNQNYIHDEMNSWVYPLHFIDFETSRSALPFHKGQRPYDQLAFQFSHHMMDSLGKITHATQFISFEKGKFPNFDFVRSLMKSLSQDEGTIFRYHVHENSVLNDIRRQLLESNEKDRDQLIEFIESTTYRKEKVGGKETEIKGKRCMVDLFEIVKDSFYHPLMGGSISIKKVLPAVLEISDFLKAKYRNPIVGKHGDVTSLNFEKASFIKMDDKGKVIDPYKSLPKVFEDYSNDDIDLLLDEEEQISNGGAAMTAYCRMQFSEMSEQEREKVRDALLKYCELDTLAMVMIVEFFIDQTKIKSRTEVA